jgi:MFS family permease
VNKVAWRIMPLIMICYLFAFFDRINISFAKFALQSSLSLSDTAYGLGAGLFSVGYVLFEVPSNMMLYKVGARRWIARIMVSWGIATALMALVQTEWQFYALRFHHRRHGSRLRAGRAVLPDAVVPDRFPRPHHLDAVPGLGLFGLVGAPAAGLVLAHMDGVLGMPGWHWLFLVGGLPCIASASSSS